MNIYIFFAIPIQKFTVQYSLRNLLSMLFIGDIHITSKHASALLEQLRTYIDTHKYEEHIVFLGDYVYHFNYDRKALLQLFSLFIELAQQGKHLYILAGNHDRITWHFVFEEARQTLLFTWSAQIHFITEPRLTTIAWVECLFLPFYYPQVSAVDHDYFPELYEETHPQRRTSRIINNILASEIQHRKETKQTDRLLLIHHRYIASTKFPWQQALFWFDSPALHPIFLENDDIRAISGHLHEPFCYKRYLCTWSVRHTSPLEINQQKCLYQLNTKNRSFYATPVWYNTYLQLPYPEREVKLTKDNIHTHIVTNRQRTQEQLNAWERSCTLDKLSVYDLTHTTITLTTPEQSLRELPDAFTQELLQEVWTVKHKLIQRNDTTLLSDLDRASLDLTNRFSDRKLLLRRFLEQKYGNQAVRYITLLQQEKLIE